MDGRLEMAVRSWAATNSEAMAAVSRVDGRRPEYLEAVLREIGLPEPAVFARSRLLYYACIGEFCVGSVHSDAERKAGALLNHAMIVRWP